MKPTLQKNWQLTAIILIGLASLAVLFLSKDTNTVMAKAAMMQGAAAITLLYVTWISITRSDEQIRISNEILNLEYQHYLAVNVDIEGDEIHLANLSKLPVYILDIRYEIETHRLVNYSLLSNVVIESGKKLTVKAEGMYLPSNPPKELTWEPNYDVETLQKELDTQWQKRYIFISYIYASTGQQQYTKLFAIEPVAVPFNSQEPRSWHACLVPLKDYGVPAEENAVLDNMR